MTQPTDEGVTRALHIAGLQAVLPDPVAGCLFCRDHRGKARGYLVTWISSGLPGSAPGLVRTVESWTPCPVCRPRK